MKFSQIERGINNFSAVSRGDQKFDRVFHPVSTTHTPPPPSPRELKNDNSLTILWKPVFNSSSQQTVTIIKVLKEFQRQEITIP